MTAIIGLMATAAFASGLTEQERIFVNALNEYRTARGLQPVTVCPQLSAASRGWSERMRARGWIGHDPNGGTEICAQIAENCGIRALRAWQRSPGHNAILLSPRIDTIGVGSADRFWTMRGLNRGRSVERTVTRTPVVNDAGLVVGVERTVERTVTRYAEPGFRVPMLQEQSPARKSGRLTRQFLRTGLRF